MFSNEVLEILFGSDYSSGSGVLKILSLSIFLVVCSGSTGTILQSLGESSKVLFSDILGAVSTIFFVLLLISKYEIYGVALGMGIGFILEKL